MYSWSYGIFLWSLFLKCEYLHCFLLFYFLYFEGRIRPFNKLLAETENRPGGESFFRRLARVISDGRVLNYISYEREIPPQM